MASDLYGNPANIQTIAPRGYTPDSSLQAATLPSTTLLHPEYVRRAGQWEKIRDAFEGEDAVKARGEKYLQRRDKMEDDEYRMYKDRAQFVNFVSRTIDALTSSIFRRKEMYKCPAKLEYLRDAATPDGLTLRQLARWSTQESCLLSRSGILLDMEKTSVPGQLARPYLSRFTAENILSWDDDNPQPKWILLREKTIRYTKNVFSRIRENSYLLLALDKNNEYCACRPAEAMLTGAIDIEEVLKQADTKYPLIFGERLNYIPFWFIGALENTPNIEKPLMLDIVNVNMAHYRGSANLETTRHYVGSPVYVITSESEPAEDEVLLISPSRVWDLGPNDKAEILEFKGTGLSSLENGQEEKEEQLRTLGAVLLSQRKNAAARSSANDEDTQAARDATLSDVVECVTSAFQNILKTAAEWIGENPDSVVFYLNRHFSVPSIGARELRSLDTMLGKSLSAKDMYILMRDAGWVTEETTEAEYIAMIEEQVIKPRAEQDKADLQASKIENRKAREELKKMKEAPQEPEDDSSDPSSDPEDPNEQEELLQNS
jgi:hypothetical protein